MPDLKRIKANVSKMASMNAPESDIDGYIASEGVSVDDVRNFTGETPIQALGNTMKEGWMRTLRAGPTSFNTLTGGPMNEFAHNIKGAGFEKMGMDQNIAENLATVTDPQSILSAQLANRAAFSKMMKPRVPGSLERLGALKTFSKNRRLVSEILPSANIAPEIEKGKVPKIQTEGLKVIKKTSDPEKLVEQFRMGKNEKIGDVDRIVGSSSKTYIDKDAISNRAREIYADDYHNASPEERVKLDKAFQKEIDFINEQPTFDATTAQARKRYLFKETERMQGKQAKGQQTVTEPEAQKVKDAFAQAYREGIEKTDPRINPLNKEIAGRVEGTKAAAKTAEVFSEQNPINLAELSAFVAGRPSPQSAVAAAVRILPKFLRSNPIRDITGKIERAGNKISSLHEKANRLNPRTKTPNLQIEAPRTGLPEPLKALPMPEPPTDIAPGPSKLDIDTLYGGLRALPSPDQVSPKIELPDRSRPIDLDRSGQMIDFGYRPTDAQEQSIMDRLMIQSSPLETPESYPVPRENPRALPEFRQLPKELMAAYKRFKKRTK